MTEKNYNNLTFLEGLKTQAFLISKQAARDEYRFSCVSESMNFDLLLRFVGVQTRFITPICSHFVEYVWRRLLKKDGFVFKAGWPEADKPDITVNIAYKYLQDAIVSQ
ncbi:hypothetical protein ACOSP7_009170 [Xanthoceras sorbifolium]